MKLNVDTECRQGYDKNMRNLTFSEGEFYHIYNRGVDRRRIFLDQKDLERFFTSMEDFNSEQNLGHLERRHGVSTDKPLVKFLAYCLNPNHFHFILEPVADKGIERFMHKLGMGHSKYINAKYRRSGALFQGSFKAVHIHSNEYLLHASAYVNLNNRVHGYADEAFTLSSWGEYMSTEISLNICKKEIILEQFKNKNEYRTFSQSTLEDMVIRKELMRELEDNDIELIHTT